MVCILYVPISKNLLTTYAIFLHKHQDIRLIINNYVHIYTFITRWSILFERHKPYYITSKTYHCVELIIISTIMLYYVIN